MVKATDMGADPRGALEVLSKQTGVSQARGSLAVTETESLRTLASAFVELAIQILGDEKEANQSEEAKAA